MRRTLAIVLAVGCSGLVYATEPNAETRSWWAHTRALANDAMRGRDTGTPEHRRAAEYVAREFEKNGIRPAGSNGYFQPVPLKKIRLVPERSTATLRRAGRNQPLRWMQHITTAAATGLPPRLDAPLVFIGSDNGAGIDTAGKIVVRLNPVRLVEGPPQPNPPANAAAVIGIDSTSGPEPQRWPSQYSVAMALADGQLPAAQAPLALRFNPQYADLLLAGSGHTYTELVDLASRGQAVPSFPLPSSLALTIQTEESALTSDNVIGVLPGSDPMLQAQHVVVSAHLDGYGVGAGWGRDVIYNGAFDNAAYVATLIDFAERLRANGTKPRRSILFAVVTAEEKGLLGSRYYTRNLTVPRESLVANINLDQLRPVFPLRTLTMHAIDESTLGDTARQVAATMDIRLQPDPEPLRNLLRRTDHWNFMQIGVPATSFVFGYVPGTEDEFAYRRWYADRYHTPLDDLDQPWLPEAAAKFNEFFGKLVMAVANAKDAPRWTPGSEFAPKQ